MIKPKMKGIGGYQPTGKPPEVLNPPKGGSNVIEPKQNWDNLYDGGRTGLPGSNIQISDNVAMWTNPSTANKELILDNVPLSEKQLHELIISQSMTIDRLLGEIGRLKDDLKVVEFSQKEELELVIKYSDALKLIQDMILKGRFYEAWIEINRALG